MLLSVSSWYFEFQMYAYPALVTIPISEDMFMRRLREFLSTKKGGKFKQDIIFNDEETMDEILYSRISFFQRPARKDETGPMVAACLNPLRDTVKAVNLP